MSIDTVTKRQMKRYAAFLGIAPAAAVGLSVLVGTGASYDKTTYANEKNMPIEQVDILSPEYISAKVGRTMRNTMLSMALIWPFTSLGLYYATLYSSGMTRNKEQENDHVSP